MSSRLDGAWRWGRASITYVASVAFCLVACSSGGDLPAARPAELEPPLVDPVALRLPFLVDDYFVPNGCFGDANCQGDVIDISGRACEDRAFAGRSTSSQSVCRRFRYRPLPSDAPGYVGFLGVLFQDVGALENSEIGRVRGIPVEAGARRVVFSAASGAAGVAVLFRAGGANNWEGLSDPAFPYRDDFSSSLEVTLSRDFQQFELDLSQASYAEVVSPFGWALESSGSIEPVDLYIDDLRWE